MARLYLPVATLAVGIASLYLFQLEGFGVYGPDEPRYAAIGRAMAATGDYVTPRLWGSPWFEKPPLLYWMTALGTSFGLGPDLCGRLPVALLSLLYLASSAVVLKDEFSLRVGVASSALLATSAGWIAFSSVCVTDIPLAVCFSGAVLAALPLLRPNSNRDVRKHMLLIGAFIGLAVLAKGLVPIALAVPFAWYLRRYWKQWWIAVAACLAVAVPWYWLVYARNGFPFIQEFFLKHHFERLYSANLLHVQPWYYYLPVFLGAMFPWTPLVGLIPWKRQFWDERRWFLAALVVFGVVFFSISRNKLASYLLPLLPCSFILIASVLETRRVSEIGRRWLLAPALLIACIPLLAPILPESLMVGRISTATLAHLTRTEIFYMMLPLCVVALARRSWAGTLLILCMVGSGIYLKATVYPAIDREGSPRTLWHLTSKIADQTCDGGTNRNWILGLSYYRGQAYPPCGNGNYRYAFRTHGRGAPNLERLGPGQ